MRYTFAADHYQYLASLGLIALFSAGLVRVGECVPASRRRMVNVGFTIVLLTALASLTFTRTAAYVDEETLWLDTIAKNPASIPAHASLAEIYRDRGELGKAIEQCEIALRQTAKTYELGPLHLELGNLYLMARRPVEATSHFRSALELRPDAVDAHFGLGVALSSLDPAQAAKHFRACLERLHPQSPDVHHVRERLRRLPGWHHSNVSP
jgi:tetratricopeptide (TPR) repeat protein